MFPSLRAHATLVEDAKFASETQRKFLNFFRNILRPQQSFPKCFLVQVCAARKQNICFASHSFARRGNITSNNVSATMFPRLRGPLVSDFNSFPVHCITHFCSDPLVSPPNLSPPWSREMRTANFSAALTTALDDFSHKSISLKDEQT